MNSLQVVAFEIVGPLWEISEASLLEPLIHGEQLARRHLLVLRMPLIEESEQSFILGDFSRPLRYVDLKVEIAWVWIAK